MSRINPKPKPGRVTIIPVPPSGGKKTPIGGGKKTPKPPKKAR